VHQNVYKSDVSNSPTCFGTPWVTSSGSTQ